MSSCEAYSITGWRLGYVIAPERIIERVKKVHDFLTVGAAAPLMEAATVGLCFPDSCFFREDVHHLIRFHFAKRDDTLNAALDRLSELDSKAREYKG